MIGLAKKIAFQRKGEVYEAISLISFDKEVYPTMNFVFGGIV